MTTPGNVKAGDTILFDALNPWDVSALGTPLIGYGTIVSVNSYPSSPPYPPYIEYVVKLIGEPEDSPALYIAANEVLHVNPNDEILNVTTISNEVYRNL